MSLRRGERNNRPIRACWRGAAFQALRLPDHHNDLEVGLVPAHSVGIAGIWGPPRRVPCGCRAQPHLAPAERCSALGTHSLRACWLRYDQV
jgi:hypothetical protein